MIKNMQKLIYFLVVVILVVSTAAVARVPDKTNIKLGTKNWINSENYFVCNFNKKPSMGVTILVLSSGKTKLEIIFFL